MDNEETPVAGRSKKATRYNGSFGGRKMCWQPDGQTIVRLLDEALLEFYKKWADLTREYIVGLGVGPQDWDAEFLKEIASRIPEIRKSAEYAKVIRLLNETAGVSLEPAKDEVPGHTDQL